VRQGLRGATAYDLFDGYCQRLVSSGMPLWRAHAAMETLHPQWEGYGYIWRRDLNAIQPERYDRVGDDADWLASPLYALVRRARGGETIPGCAGVLRWRQNLSSFRSSRLSLPKARRTILRNSSLSEKTGPLPRERDRLLLRLRSDRRFRRR